MTTRLAIDDVRPSLSGSVPSKAVVDEVIPVTALVWREGHDAVAATLSVWNSDSPAVSSVTMDFDSVNPDRVHGVFTPATPGRWFFRVDAWSDPMATWRNAITKKMEAGQSAQELSNDLLHGTELFERASLQSPTDKAALLIDAARALSDESLDPTERVQLALSEETTKLLHTHPLRDLLVEGEIHEVLVERREALFNSWYELFPRSTGGWDENGQPVHGTFKTTQKALERVAEMGFDTVYFPPIHPIGEVHRKGKNNSVVAEPDDVGSPWAIQDHSATHPQLGTMEDFKELLARAKELGLEVALDLALQASPDHPWAQTNPEFFTVLPDGTIAYAENPPKKYQDIYPLNFDNDPDGIYNEIFRVVMLWVDAGVTTFRVDNPHTKPANFWNWLISKVHVTHPEVIFLAEAFTRAPRLFGLAKAGFTQSYTYFTWQTSKYELTKFAKMHVEQADICRPNLFVNTPDILHESLQTGGRAMFAIRAVLAATLSPLWGVYSGYELYEHEAVAPGSEEYLDSEKYELRPRDFQAALKKGASLEAYIRLLNLIRRENPALQQLRNLKFHNADNENIIAYSKADPATGNVVLAVVNLDPRNAQEATVTVDMEAIGRADGDVYTVHDAITGAAYNWSNRNFVRLEPMRDVAHVFVLPQADSHSLNRLAWRDVDDYRA
ncbi:alpha-1,4-glucan--maltose-1-phosphate maltosyltransferase [Corynebacterium striatum]|uniref:maltotransferase domain-containing protein n=1 Tax=Corynebacterium striatum TaxID=43770 RepID=UPI000C1CC835|nr:maltotransferase domain-containing protein [Corynebacterium striatum]PIS59276.1 alpha-1,4-glucan--maltose-1-phosphate maltosyltransferase [Corynebacterium striatum]PIS61592.1 alpha-1,4-glucan--maltose-1-phosphate maltosyltransferase [Corynebacterium striatum]PIS65583.1 alpha-1,4-glucan--maltose-1-phosphate maltosyltransferase [Corynebacterium striatum]PXY07210.1 alpha-1,4-glucan--maltose-1-phosphate maltosyltransferase [Corynebacterium striatum]PXY08297.1 alpha-1,4-glucan--maltose-1-phospha